MVQRSFCSQINRCTSRFAVGSNILPEISRSGSNILLHYIVTKKSKNIYYMFKVNIDGAGIVGHTSGESRLDTLIYANSEDLASHRTHDQIFKDVSEGEEKTSRGLSWNNVYLNSGYRLIGFNYNGVDLDLVDAVTTAGSAGALIDNVFTIKEKSGYTDLIAYMDGMSQLYLDENTTSVDRYVNVLTVRYEVIGYNIAYHVKDGIGGAVSNDADAFTQNEKDNGKKADESKLIRGSTAIADVDNDYVFDHWEDENGELVGDGKTWFVPDIATITDPDKIYNFYAVFRKNKWLKIEYEAENPEHGSVSLDSELLSLGETIQGSTARPETGWEFDYWSIEGKDDIKISEGIQYYVPGAPYVMETDYRVLDEVKTIRFVAHFKPSFDTKISVSKNVKVLDEDTLDINSINTSVYVCLQMKTDSVSLEDLAAYKSAGIIDDAGYVLNNAGDVYYKQIRIVNGMPSPTTVIYEGIPLATYDVWEMHKVTDGVYVSQYNGMPITEEYKLSGLSVNNKEDEKNNNAYLTVESPETNVTFTNTYASPDTDQTFRARKEWLNANGTTTAPEGASVIFTVYSKAENVITAVKSVQLDGVVFVK